MAQRILGIDLGPTEVRAVLVESAFRGPTPRAAARAPVAPETEGGPPLAERQAAAVSALLADGLTCDVSLVALPGPCALHAVSLPFTDPRRIEQTVGFEVEGQLPFDLDEASWDWQLASVRGGKAELLVAVARKEVVSQLLAALATAGLDPRAVLPPAPAYAALFGCGVLAGEEPSAAAEPGVEAPAEALLDLDEGRASLCLVRFGACEAARTFTVGDDPATLAREVRGTFKAWRARSGDGAPPRRLLLAGRAAALPGLAEALRPVVEAPVEPVTLTGAAALLAPGEEADFALALALALRGHAGSRAPRLNLRRGELAYTRDFQHLRGKLLRLAGFAAALLLLALASLGVRTFALSRQEALLDRALCEATQKLVGKCYDNDELAVAALRGRGTAAAAIPESSALDVLTELSLRAPQSVVLRFDRIDITRDKLHLQGTTDAAENVDRIVTSLRAGRCFADARSGGARKRSTDGKFEFTVDSDLTCEAGAAPAGKG